MQTSQTETDALAGRRGALSAFLALLWMWLRSGNELPEPIFDGAAVDRQYRAVWNYRYNRRQRRIAKSRSIKAFRYPSAFDRVLSRGLSSTQRMERLARLSINGRIRVYGMRCFGSVLQRRARLVCYDHGWWREPLGPFGRLRGGVWLGHLWPGWV